MRSCCSCRFYRTCRGRIPQFRIPRWLDGLTLNDNTILVQPVHQFVNADIPPFRRRMVAPLNTVRHTRNRSTAVANGYPDSSAELPTRCNTSGSYATTYGSTPLRCGS